MCATCIAQGVAYVGGALAGLQVMAARAAAKRRRSGDPVEPEPASEQQEAGPQPARRQDEPDLPNRPDPAAV